ncbi:hypothetical protein [Membranihabitans marinus]|uniref:hypothetical protein n=1 Tax=Membranihabitans marinus TaxID=1227546 RepID=UPI001F481A1D|nr:hypothetical protein [Membranihabitans marinus]
MKYLLMKSRTTFIAICIVLCFGCEKSATEPEVLSFDDLYARHVKSQWNLTTFHNALMGGWKFKESKCCAVDADCETVLRSDLIYVFSKNIITVAKEGEITEEIEYSVVKDDFGFKIQTLDPVEFIDGEVYMTEDQLLFYLSPLDGCDSYFVRNK